MTIRDLDGQVVSGATLVSDSGLDWRLPVGAAAVPEPASTQSLLTGMAALAWWLRRRGPQATPI